MFIKYSKPIIFNMKHMRESDVSDFYGPKIFNFKKFN